MTAQQVLKKWLRGLMIGSILGILDVVLVYTVEQSASIWTLTQVFFAWLAIGWTVIAVPSHLPPIPHSLILVFFLSIPWYINESIRPGKWEYLAPLLVQGLIHGLIFGFYKRYLDRREYA